MGRLFYQSHGKVTKKDCFYGVLIAFVEVYFLQEKAFLFKNRTVNQHW